MPYPPEHAARIADPDKFEKDSFRSKEIALGIRIIMGKMAGSDSIIAQAYRFDAEKFTPEQAKDWLKEHHIELRGFEPAAGMHSTLTDKPKFDNGVWIPFLKDGQLAENNQGRQCRLSKSAIDAGYKSYIGGFININHLDKIKGKIADVKREGEFAFFKPEGLDDEALAVINSAAYRGVSQQSLNLSSETKPDGTIEVLSLSGTGVAIALYPKMPGCPISAGCGIPNSDFSLNNQNSNSIIKNNGGTNNNMTNGTDGADALKSITAERDALKIQVDALTAEIAGIKTHLGIHSGEAIQSTTNQSEVEARIREINAANLITIKSALDTRDREYAEKEKLRLEREGLIKELSSCSNAQALEKLLATNPSNIVLKSSLEFVRGLGVSMPGVGVGEEVRSANLGGLKQFEAGREIYEKLGLTEKDFIGVK